MTDPQQPPSGGVPPVPPMPPQPPAAPPVAPPAYAPTPPSAPAYPTAQPAVPTAQPAAPVGQHQAAPPGAYQVPVGGYASPAGAYQAPSAPAPKTGALGIVALILAVIAAVVAPIIGVVAGFEIGKRIPGGLDTTDPNLLFALAPARGQVLIAEIAFWGGTILGIAAIVVGILAIRKKQRRGLGITALVVAIVGPVVFWVGLVIAISIGTATAF